MLHVPPRAVAYQRAGYTIGLFGVGWHGLFLWLILRTGLSARLRNGVYRGLRRPLPLPGEAPGFAALGLFLAQFLLLEGLWRLPVGLSWLWLERRYGFGRESVANFVGDELLQQLLSGVVLIPLAWAGLRLYAWQPRRWWLWLWAGIGPLLFVQLFLQPLVIDPAFNRFTPLPPGPLKSRILALAATSGITDGRVWVSDTSRRSTHVNAYVTGLGASTRIVINDTALQTLPEDQILAMVGHEMGHYVEGHLWVRLASATLGAGLFLWLASRVLPWLLRRQQAVWQVRGPTDVAAVPAILLVLWLFLEVQMPIANALSRWQEHRADEFGLRVTGLSGANVRLFTGFAEREYSDPDPPLLMHLWYGTHPTLRERILNAQEHTAPPHPAL